MPNESLEMKSKFIFMLKNWDVEISLREGRGAEGLHQAPSFLFQF